MLEQLIREKAYQIWEAEGYPEGRAEAHWELARSALSDAVKPATEKSKRAASSKPRTKKART